VRGKLIVEFEGALLAQLQRVLSARFPLQFYQQHQGELGSDLSIDPDVMGGDPTRKEVGDPKPHDDEVDKTCSHEG
jgi:hypothetical protein